MTLGFKIYVEEQKPKIAKALQKNKLPSQKQDFL